MKIILLILINLSLQNYSHHDYSLQNHSLYPIIEPPQINNRDNCCSRQTQFCCFAIPDMPIEPQLPFPRGMWSNDFFTDYSSYYRGPTRNTGWKLRTPVEYEEPAIKPFYPFNLEKYLGCWYQAARTKKIPFQNDDETKVKAEYERIDGLRVKVTNTSYKGKDVCDSRSGVATFAGNPHVGSLNVSFPNTDYPQFNTNGGNYNILDTDYDTYSIVYSFSPFGTYVWVLTRELNCHQNLVRDLVEKAARKLNLSEDDFIFMW